MNDFDLDSKCEGALSNQDPTSELHEQFERWIIKKTVPCSRFEISNIVSSIIENLNEPTNSFTHDKSNGHDRSGYDRGYDRGGIFA